MNFTRSLVICLFVVFSCCKNTPKEEVTEKAEALSQAIKSKPKVSFTFDDGITRDVAGFKFEKWNEMILSHLDTAGIKAVFFVTGRNKLNDKGQFLLNSWDSRGHSIANHSFTHPNFNGQENTALMFEDELLKTDAVISGLENYIKLFRFPYLKEGQTLAKVDSIRNILAAHNYTNGYVTIDASDWYVSQRLVNRINEVGLEATEVDKFRDFYIQHLLEKADYYEGLSYEMHDRHIDHTLLLHHNLAAALFLGDLIKAFEDAGWEIMDADLAFQDEVFKHAPSSEYAGEGLIYALAKQSESYRKLLRYPAEDSRYEKTRMDSLGL